MKKLFIISSVLLGITLLFLGVYNFAFKKDTPVVSQSAEKISQTEDSKKIVTEKKSEKIVAMIEQQIVGAVLDKKNEEIRYYDVQNGTAWVISEEGKGKRQLSETKISGLRNVIWSPDKNKVLTTIEKNGQNVFFEYDYSLQKSIQMKDGADTVVWDNTGTKIFYKYYNESDNTRSLNIANPDGSGWQKIADIEHRNLLIASIPLSSLVSFWNFPNSKEETKLQVVGAIGGETKTILTGKFGADYLWSPDGSRALVSSISEIDGKKITLGLVSVNGEYVDLKIPTIVSKCTWSVDGKTIYYALPGNIPAEAIMPNDYQENKFNTNDTFWKINIEKGESQRIIETVDISGKYDSSNLFLSSVEDALYFTNRTDKKLYRLSL